MTALQIELYDKVLLKSGETAFIVEIYDNGKAFEADIDRNGDTVTDTILPDDILRIIK